MNRIEQNFGDCLMVKTSVGDIGFGLGSRDAGLASALSFLPGLGQIYNGQARKGLLFLATTASYLFVFLLIIFNQGLIYGLNSFGQSFHMQPDSNLISVLHELHAGSTLSFIVSALFLGFVVYAIKDAYQYANYLQNRYIYADCALEMMEATSGSYLLHFIGIIILFLVAVFYLQHTHPQSQITYIEFVQDQLPTKKIIQSKRASTKASENTGLHQPKPIVAPSHHATDIAKIAAQPSPKFHPVIARTAPVTLAPQQLVSTTIPNRPPLPVVTASVHPNVMPPAVSQINNQTKAIMPQPALSEKNKSVQSLTPNLNAGPAIITAPGGQLPTPVSVGSSHSNKFMPTPIATNSGSLGTNNTSGLVPAIGPIHAGGHSSYTPGITVKPVVPKLGEARGTPGENILGNPPKYTSISGPTNIDSMPVDFSAYMADLQRRIKQSWFPTKDDVTRRVIVFFKIHKYGELSDLRLDSKHPSGSDKADRAALKAVENAAPFRQLPSGAQENVDIQFTFDYTVFSGTGMFRKF